MDGPGPLATTFSIVGYDPDAPAWGIAVASRFLAVGASTCWGAPSAGVVVIQAHFNTRPRRSGLAPTGRSCSRCHWTPDGQRPLP